MSFKLSSCFYFAVLKENLDILDTLKGNNSIINTGILMDSGFVITEAHHLAYMFSN